MRYSEPFFVGRGNPRFRGVSASGYLPALEEPEEPTPEVTPIGLTQSKISQRIQQLEARCLYLQRKLWEKPRKVDKQYKYS